MYVIIILTGNVIIANNLLNHHCILTIGTLIINIKKSHTLIKIVNSAFIDLPALSNSSAWYYIVLTLIMLSLWSPKNNIFSLWEDETWIKENLYKTKLHRYNSISPIPFVKHKFIIFTNICWCLCIYNMCVCTYICMYEKSDREYRDKSWILCLMSSIGNKPHNMCPH